MRRITTSTTAPTGLDCKTWLEALDHCQDIALGVLEPGGLGTAPGRDAFLGLHARHVVVLKLYAPGFQLGDLALDVLDLPERLARLGRSSVWRWIHEARSMLGE